jgi:hypothetical protein
MPQPFKGDWSSNKDVLKQRPKLAAHIAHIAHLWTQVDLALGHVVINMLKADAASGAAMFLSLRGARPAALDAVAQYALDADALKEFRQLTKKVRTVEGSRNDVVHGMWALPKQGDDSLVWLDAASWVAWMAANTALHHKSSRATNDDWTRMKLAMEVLNKSALEYKEADFIDIENRIQDLLAELAQFQNKFRISLQPRSVERFRNNTLLDSENKNDT